MKGYMTSFAELFLERPDNTPTVTSIEIPLIQRDYAQGRRSDLVKGIRNDFLDVLRDAVTGGQPVGLDFIWGDVKKNGTLRPLDGQQRLTTLFLLHWYLSYRASQLVDDHPWKRFSYATRPSARLFCKRLVAYPPPPSCATPAEWVTDQPWYLHVWRHDPTIQSMLVMIEAIHERFQDDSAAEIRAAWERLLDPNQPAISFQLLPIKEMGAGEELYIKMNSRGKPLTQFETFKAQFEKTIAWSERASEFADKVDGRWSDLLWHLRGDDNIIDDEFMRYLGFVTEICEWREGELDDRRPDDLRLEQRTQRLFGADNPRAPEHLEFLFHAFDRWRDEEHIRSVFNELFRFSGAPWGSGDSAKVVVFGANVNVNLFEACCERFGDLQGSGPARSFTLTESFLLYAVLLHLIHDTKDVHRRVRTLRNVLSFSENEMRRQNLPKLVNEVETIIVQGTLDGVTTFNQAQVAEERQKQELLAQHPDDDLSEAVFHLEDHSLLRGSLAAFELNPATLTRHAEAFDRTFSDPEHWPDLTGALLATGEYQRHVWRTDFYFGTGSRENESAWRWLFTNKQRPDLEKTRQVLAKFLDAVDIATMPLQEHLASVRELFLWERQASAEFDWRFYLVRYDCMREGATGRYIDSDERLGYTLCMLRKSNLNSYYRDPFLLAIWRESAVGDAVEDPWFRGYETNPRWLRLANSGAQMRCLPEGIALRPPPPVRDDLVPVFEAVCQQHEDITKTADDDWLLVVAQEERDGVLIDSEDRVQKGATLLATLVARGL